MLLKIRILAGSIEVSHYVTLTVGWLGLVIARGWIEKDILNDGFQSGKRGGGGMRNSIC